jgi:hypothetical protein
LALVSALTLASATHSKNLIGLLSIDANTQGNTATSLGPIDGCARVEPGAQIDVDYIVDAVPQDRPLIAFEVDIRYNPDLIEIVAVDHDLMLAAVGQYQPFVDLTDPLPDADGDYRLVVLDTASQTELRDPGTGEITQPEANVERGKGVLARVTLRAKAPGISEVTVGFDPPDGPYPLTQDTQNETIIVDKIGGVSIAIGQDCPPEVIPPKIIDAPNSEECIFGGQCEPTPEGQTPGPDNPTPTLGPTAVNVDPDDPTPEGQTPTPGPGDEVLVPCPVRPLPTPPPATPDPAATTAPAEGETPVPSPELTSTPAPELCTPTPAPLGDDIANESEDSNTGLLVGAVALLGIGTAAAGGGWYAFRRSRNGT